MATEFEQTKRDMSGRSIVITSWYDEQKKNWRASAPGYSHIHAVGSPVDKGTAYPTRKSAIDRVVSLLTTHFANPEKRAVEQVIFL